MELQKKYSTKTAHKKHAINSINIDNKQSKQIEIRDPFEITVFYTNFDK